MEDLRGWLDCMREHGRVRDVVGVDWKLEVGAITDMNVKRKKWVLLFDEIQGYQQGFRIVTGTLLDAARVSYTLGTDSGSDVQLLVRSLRSRLRDRPEASTAPDSAFEDAPMAANRMSGDDVDLSIFPAPQWHAEDGGRYLGTFDAVITRDPDSGWVNVGTYRMMVYGPRRLCLFVNSSHHARLHMESYRRRGERVPVAVSLGHHPSLSALAGMELPAGVSEFDVLRQVRGEGMDLVEGPVTGLPVPRESEILIEGFLSEGTVSEGPYGEFLGYYAGGKMQTPTLDVEAVYYRDDPIIVGTCAGVPPYDYSYFRAPMRSAMIWDALEDAGVPGIAGVWCHEAGYTRALNVIAVEQAYLGHPQQAGMVASQVREGAFGGKYTIVVDSDIDPSDLEQVMWAMCTRTDPAESIEFIRHSWGMALDPMVERGPDDALNELPMSRAVVNACRPFKRHARGTFPVVVTVDDDVASRVTEKYPDVLG